MQKIITVNKRIQLCFLLIAICSMQSIAQVEKELPCRQPKLSKEKIDKMIKTRKMARMSSELSTLAITPPQLRVYFVICSDSDGSSVAAADTVPMKEFKTMEADFGPGNICLVFAGVGRLANTYLNHIDVDAETNADDLFESHRIPGCLTIFITKEIRGTNNASGGKIGGITFDLPGTFCLVSGSSVGRHTSSHEVGHCLELLHTFASKGFEHEKISGTNCDISGDLVCDTNADPYVFKTEEDNCFGETNGFYSGVCKDPDERTGYDPPYNNIMSYWHHSPETFTNEQFAIMRTTIRDDADVNPLASVNDYIMYPATYNFEYVYKSAINSLTTLGDINFNLLAHGGLFGKVVTLTPGFDAKPSAGGSTIIRATICTGSATVTSSRPITSTQTEIKTNDAPLLVYPNPTNGVITFTYKQDKVFNPSLVIRNIHGQVVYSLAKQKKIQQINQKIDISKQPKGLYIIELNTGEKRMTQKIILQ